MKKLLFILAILLPAMAQAQSLPNFPLNKVFNVVQTDAALRALSVANLIAGTQVKDTGYYAAGDMPEATYTYQTASCPLNSGAGDGGSQIPPNAGAGCWLLNAEQAYDYRQWGVVPSYLGSDPNANNATQMTAAITAAGAIGNLLTTGGQAVVLTGGGLQYVINAPVLNRGAAGFVNFKDTSLLAGSATNFSSCSTAIFENNSSSVNYFDNFIVDSNRYAVNGFLSAANGTNRYNNFIVQHWEGSCANTTSNVTTTSGSYIVADTNTASLATGMVSRGNAALGIPDRSIIVGITANTNFTITKPATAAASGSATFYTDVNGITCGQGGSNCGGTWTNLNSFEWNSGDAEVGIPADRFGYGFACYSGCNDVLVTNAAFADGLANIYQDYGSGGIKLVAGELNNANWSTPEINAANILEADNSGVTKLTSVDSNGGMVEIFVTDSAGNIPTTVWTSAKFAVSSNVTYPNGATAVQVYTSLTGTNLKAVSVDPGAALVGTAALVTSFGPGTVTSTPLDFQYSGGVIDNANIGTNTPGLVSAKNLTITASVNPGLGLNSCAGNTLCLFANSAQEMLIGTTAITLKQPAIASGTTFTTTGSCGTISSRLGGGDTGSFVSGISGTCTVTLAINGASGSTAPNGWACQASDLTTVADTIKQTAYTTTTATISGTTASGDLIAFSCKGF